MSGVISASFSLAKFKQQHTKYSKQLSEEEEEEEEPEYAAWFRVWLAWEYKSRDHAAINGRDSEAYAALICHNLLWHQLCASNAGWIYSQVWQATSGSVSSKGGGAEQAAKPFGLLVAASLPQL